MKSIKPPSVTVVCDEVYVEGQTDDFVKSYDFNELKAEEKAKNAGRKKSSSKSKNDRHFPCCLCGKEYTSKGILKTHIQLKHQDIVYTYRCNQCEFVAKRKQDLKYHVESKHDGFRYGCNQCE